MHVGSAAGKVPGTAVSQRPCRNPARAGLDTRARARCPTDRNRQNAPPNQQKPPERAGQPAAMRALLNQQNLPDSLQCAGRDLTRRRRDIDHDAVFVTLERLEGCQLRVRQCRGHVLVLPRPDAGLQQFARTVEQREQRAGCFRAQPIPVHPLECRAGEDGRTRFSSRRARTSSTRSSHGHRSSSSSSGCPAAIFALFASGCRSSASTKSRPSANAKSRPSANAMSRPTVDLPQPDTPMTTMGGSWSLTAAPFRVAAENCRCPKSGFRIAGLSDR